MWIYYFLFDNPVKLLKSLPLTGFDFALIASIFVPFAGVTWSLTCTHSIGSLYVPFCPLVWHGYTHLHLNKEPRYTRWNADMCSPNDHQRGPHPLVTTSRVFLLSVRPFDRELCPGAWDMVEGSKFMGQSGKKCVSFHKLSSYLLSELERIFFQFNQREKKYQSVCPVKLGHWYWIWPQPSFSKYFFVLPASENISIKSQVFCQI